ncbi:MAG: DciA family protein [Bacteroidota bacterium]
MIPISQAIQQYLDQHPHQDRLTTAQILLAWKQLMPAPVQKRIQKAFVKQDKLFVKVGSAALRQSLVASKSRILERMQEPPLCCQIRDIVVY